MNIKFIGGVAPVAFLRSLIAEQITNEHEPRLTVAVERDWLIFFSFLGDLSVKSTCISFA